ncbi:hypothetical protein [Haloarcula marina]|uniref:hypothetical protein n=1 Tax=Haloarcula marina TaxID=2961574 RepID=UPI0020B81354|nr:hypothetical protein [Halomicroarcula marina]
MRDGAIGKTTSGVPAAAQTVSNYGNTLLAISVAECTNGIEIVSHRLDERTIVLKILKFIIHDVVIDHVAVGMR